MANKIKPKRSYTANAVPTTSDLETNELAIRWDASSPAMFTKNAAGNIVSVTLGGSGGGSGSLSGSVTIPESGDAQWANTVLLLKGDAGITDSSSGNRTGTNNGTTISSTRMFGAGSLSMGGGNISFANETAFDMGTAWTVEAWVYIPSFGTDAGLACRGDLVAGSGWDGCQFSIRIGGNANVTAYFWGSGNSEQIVDCASALTASTWQHIAVVRDGAVGRVYVGGVLIGSRSDLNTPVSSNFPIIVGKWTAYRSGSNGLQGLIDDFRVTKAARYSGSSFTPPTAAHQTGTYTAAQTLPVTVTGSGGTAIVSSVAGRTGAVTLTSADVSGVVPSTTTGITGATAITNIISLTQSSYDAIGSKSATTLYIING